MHPIIKLYKQTKKARNTYLCTFKKMKKTHLKLLLAYLKKHKELKTIYNSYKELLQLILMYRKKFQYFNHISKPLISKKDMKLLIKQQNTILSDVDKLGELIPNMKTFI